MAGLLELKVYQRHSCAVFYRTADLFGGLSNMASGYPLTVDGVPILTTEALYQACRYPHHPAIQREILAQASPIAAKMKSKHYYPLSRPDWEVVRVPVMAWCLRLKLAQHWEPMSQLLLATGRRPIVEASFRDQFWGAVSMDTERLVGANVLGCLLGALRDRVRQGAMGELRVVTPPGIPDLCLLGQRIGE